MKVENWHGHHIRFVEVDGEWWAILKDICDALDLHTFKVSQRLDPDMMRKAPIEVARIRPSKYRKNYDIPSKYNVNSKSTVWMTVINEYGIYEALFGSTKLEARQFRRWGATVFQKLRQNVGLEGYEIMRMTDTDVQDEIDDILDTLFYDEKTGLLMQSVTVQGGDVEQVPFEG